MSLVFDLDFLCKKIFIQSKVYKSYRKIISFYWKCQTQLFEDINNDVAALLLKSQYFYAIYDMVNKFYISVVY